MTIENSSSVDGLGISKNDGKAVLTISDHLNWQNEGRHFLLLEKKIDAYLNFIKTGQLLEVLPNCQNQAIRIEVICQHQPSQAAMAFLGAAKRQLDVMGIELAYGVLSDKY